VGGTETYAAELLKAFARAENDTEFVVFLNAEAHSFPVPESPRFKKVVCMVHAANRVKRYLFEQFVLPVMALRYNLDLMHSLGYVGPVLIVQKHIITIHDANFVRLSHQMKPLKRWIYGLIVKLSAKTCSHVVTISGFSKQELVGSLGLSRSKLSVVAHGAPNVPDYMTEAEADQPTWARKPYILVLGGGSVHKNISAFVEAFVSVQRRIPHSLVIAGRLAVSLGSNPKVAGLLKSGKITITGFLDDQSLDLAYRGADLFVFPTLYEGFGLPVLEAQARGVPVLCSKVASLPEIGADSVEYLDPHCVTGMADALVSLVGNPARLKELREAGYMNAARFTWERAAAQTQEIYSNLLAR
jgi:glycosyltransferase involved in cell wall biosynthesis